MDLKSELGKCILDVSEQKPKDFYDKLEGIMADKLKTKLSAQVKDAEAQLFKKHK